MRILGLPIEYYNQHVLTFISNRIEKSIKLDKNKLSGEYVRLCIQVYLTKGLLAMFSIKGRHFKVEYEGLHTLCLKCGMYGHIVEGCEVQYVKGNSKYGENMFGSNGSNDIVAKDGEQGNQKGHWTIVQKTKRGRRGK